MTKRSFTYEVYFGSPKISAAAWQSFCFQITKLLGGFAHPKLSIILEEQTFHFYLSVNRSLPSGIGLTDFMLKSVKQPKVISSRNSLRTVPRIYFDNFLTLAGQLQRKHRHLLSLEFNLHAVMPTFCLATVAYSSDQGPCTYHIFSPLARLLSADFTCFPNYTYKKFPKYLSSAKVMPHLSLTADPSKTLFHAETFPFDASKSFLNLESFDFNKHSLVLGSSGSGKSRFLSLLIDRIYRNYADQYKIIVIDPHDALYRDLTTISNQKIFNFSNTDQSIDLFQNPVENPVVASELLLGLFRKLMSDNFNSRLERVLRFGSQLLLSEKAFSFTNLRRLLLDLEYRNQLLRQPHLASNISEFFLTDFNLLKTQSYDLAIAPIIAFLDEASSIPALSSTSRLATLTMAIEQNFLNIFSLNQLRLGDKMIRTIAGLLLQQIFLLAKSGRISQDLIVIIDEVAVIEHPILQSFLSELRKYHVSVILAGQYFGQLTENLREAIFANTVNYYLFRVSRNDANLLTKSLNLPLQNGNIDDAAKFLAELNHRECVLRFSFAEKLQPAFKARTLDFLPPPYLSSESAVDSALTSDSNLEKPELQFDIETTYSIDDLMREHTTNRKKFNGENYD